MSPLPDVPETWFSRALPVLTSIVARYETDGGTVFSGHVVDDTGLDEGAVEQAARALERANYFRASWDGGGGFDVIEISERARREVGAWPTAEALTSRLLAALEAMATSPSEQERSGARRLLAAATGDGRAALAGAVGNLLAGAVI